MQRFTLRFIASLALAAAGSVIALQAQAPGSGVNQWTRTTDLHTPRAQACSVLLPDGRMLVAGGAGPSGAMSAVELYNTDGTFSVANPMLQSRTDSACTTLPGGRVLVTGGSNGLNALNSAEIFDPVSGNWSAAANMSTARQGHQSVLTPWGSVLIAGGRNASGTTGSVEIYSVNLDEFQPVGALASPRSNFGIAALPHRRILFFGGTDGSATLMSVEVYDANTGSIAPAGSMLQARQNLGVAALLDGTVLLTGGFDNSGNALASTEIFDLNQGASVAGPNLLTARANHLSSILPNNGSVLIAGGTGANGILASSEAYSPITGAITQVSAMNFARQGAASALLRPGRFIVAGGKNDSNFLSSSELYGFATIQTDQPDYAPGSAVTILGTGWTPGEQVMVKVIAFPLDQHHVEFTGSGIADGSGAVKVTGFTVDQSHFGIDFLMTATGSQSQAQSLFSDGDTTAIVIDGGTPASPSSFGTAVTFTGSVTDITTPATVPTGTVAVTLNGSAVPNGTATLDGNGNYSFTFNAATQFLPVKNANAIQVVYNGNGGLGASPPQTANYVTKKVAPVFIVVATPAGALPGTPVTVTVSTTAIGGILVTGSVTLAIDGSSVGPPITLSGGGATFTLNGTGGFPTGLAGGSHTIGVIYDGVSATYLPQSAASNQITFGVKVATTVLITSSNGVSGSNIPFSSATPYVATITPTGGGVATGTLTFSVDGAPYANGVVTVGAGNAGSFVPNPALAVGAHVITAVYSGDTVNSPSSASPAFNVTVVAATTTTAVSFSPGASIVFGQPLTVTGTVTTPGSVPTGSVTFTQDGAPGAAVTLTNGVATTLASSLPVAASPHSFSVQYTSNTTGFASSASGAQNVTVTAAAASIGTPLFVSGNVSNGQNILVSVVATPVAPSTQTPTGSVTFFDGATQLGSAVTLASGSASATLPNFTAGNHSITAVFASNNGNFSAATSGALPLTTGSQTGTVTVATPTLSGTATFGQSQTFTTSVAAVQPNVLTATGTVTFLDGATPIGLPQSVTGTGPVSVTASLTGGSHSVTAAFVSNNGNFSNLTSAALPVTIAKANANVTVTSTNVLAGQSVNDGGSITLTATFTGSSTPVPTGSVSFVDTAATPNTTICASAALTNGVATCTATVLSPLFTAGNRSISVTYPSDQNYQLGTVTQFKFTVALAVTKIVVSATPNPAVLSQPEVLSAAVTVPNVTGVTPTGTVAFNNGGSAIANCGAQPVVSGIATCSVTFPAKASLSLTAVYSGDANTSTITSDGLTLAVNGLPSSIAATVVPAKPAYGTLTINVTVTGTAGGPVPTGTVTISENGGQTIPLTLNAAGQATLVAPSAGVLAFTAGNHNLSVVYGGDANYAPPQISAPLTFTVTQAATTTSLVAGPAGSLMLTATVTPNPAGGTPTGSVTFSNGTTTFGPVALVASNGVFTATFAAGPANGTVTATYLGDANYTGSTSPAVTIAKNNLNFTVTSNVPAGQTVTVGSSVTFIATLSGSATPAATGTVSFVNGSTVLCSATVVNGVASCTMAVSTPAFNTGSNSISLTYSSDPNYGLGVVTPFTLLVGLAGTNTALTASPNPAVVGQTVTLSAAVSSAIPGITPTGTVMFSTGNGAIANCTAQPLIGGVATCNTAFAAKGSASVTARYSGDSATSASTSPSVTLPLNGLTSTVSATVITTKLVYGSLGIGVAVTGPAGSPIPTGTVTISEAGGQTITLTLNGAGLAALAAPATGVLPYGAGTHTLSIVYSGDSTYAGSAAAPLIFTIGQAATTTSLAAAGQLILIATVAPVAPGSGIPTGTVTFFNGATSFGSAPLVAVNGVFTATFSGGPSNGTLTAVYSGDSNFTGSTSSTVTRSSASLTDTVTITANPNPVIVGQSVTFTITVAGSSSPGATGAVQIIDNGVVVGTVNLNGFGSAVFTETPSPGSHSIVAAYAGDANYPANSASFGFGTTKPSVSLSLKSSVIASVFGQTVVLTAAVAGQAPGATAPTGQMNFYDGATLLGTAPIVSGVATLSIAILAPGSHSITVVYSGDSNWAASTANAVTVTVSKAATTTALVGAATGNNMTLTAMVTPVLPGAGAPTGTVNFLDSVTNASLGSAIVAGGNAAITVAANSDSIVAVYSGDGNFLTSSSTPLIIIAAVNSASYQATFAPDETVTIFGANFVTSTQAASTPFPTNLGGLTVTVTDSAGTARPAVLFYVSANQISLVIPAGTAGGKATVSVTTSAGVTLTTTAIISAVAPGIFAANANGQGVAAAQTVRVHANGTQDAPANAATASGSTFVGAPINLSPSTDTLYLILYGTGIRHSTQSVTVTINGTSLPLQFAGAQGSTPGLDQVNVMLPQSLAGSGQANVVVTVDGQAANTVTVTFQ